MPDILKEILDHKVKEVADRKSSYPISLLEKSPYFDNPCVSMKDYLQQNDKHGIIAEIKRKSPSRGDFHSKINVEELSAGYVQAGASALSILTDERYFGGSKEDLMAARKSNYCPILRKDFIVDEYQLFEARSWGADVVLLIAAALTTEHTKNLAKKAADLGMEVLLEVHNREEAESYINEYISIVGVNNRNLKSFETRLDQSILLAEHLPQNLIKISESGIRNAQDIMMLREYGYKGFLIGESFMKSNQPQDACKQLVNELNKLNDHAQS